MLSIGVEGLSVTPAFAPEFKMTFRVRSKWRTDSTCTIISSHPASMNIGDKRSGSSTIKCASKGISTLFLHEATVSGPIVRFGTKFPSIMSQWIRSAPASSRASHSKPKRLKSAGRIEGHISMWRLFSVIQGPQSVGGLFNYIITQTFSLLVIISFLTNYASLPACWKDDIRIQDTLGVERLFHFSKKPNLLFISLEV